MHFSVNPLQPSATLSSFWHDISSPSLIPRPVQFQSPRTRQVRDVGEHINGLTQGMLQHAFIEAQTIIFNPKFSKAWFLYAN
jgi:hypothetical protein